jgi:hypothetical protein
VANATQFNNTTSSTSTTTGAVTIAGGLGVQGNINFGGNLYQNGVLFTGGGGSSVTVSDTPPSSPTNGALWWDSQVGNLAIYYTSAGAWVDAVTQYQFNGGIVTGATQFTNTTSSTSSTTGAVTVVGGVGIGGNLNVGGTLTAGAISLPSASFTYANLTTASIGTATIGSLIVTTTENDLGILAVSGLVQFTNTTSSTSTTSGALVVAGGVGIGGNLTVGGTITANQLTIQYTTITQTQITSPDIFTITNATSATSTITGALVVAGGVGIGGALYANNAVFISTATSTSTTTGAVVVGGGLGVGGNIYAGGSIYVNGGLVSNVIISDTPPSNPTAGQFWWDSQVGNLAIWYVSGGSGQWVDAVAQNVFNGGVVANAVTIASTTSATSTVTGALQVAGGVGIQGNLYVGGNIVSSGGVVGGGASSTGTTSTFLISSTASSTSTLTGALIVTGGVGVGGSVNIGGTVTGGGIRATTTSTAPSGATAGDIWYDPVNDVTYRYTNDGAGTYWLDISGAATVGGSVTSSTLQIIYTSTFSGGFIVSSIIPSTSGTLDLGSPTNRFRTLYVTSSTIDIGGVPVSAVGGGLQIGTGSNIVNVTKSTTGSTPPSNPNVGDIWYNSSTDVTARWTFDGASYYWVDIAGLTLGTVSSATLALSGGLVISATTSATSTTTGALQVAGGVGISGDIVSGGYVSSQNTFGFKNRIINGAMTIDQRNNGASVISTVDGSYTLDRWKLAISQASKFAFQQNAGSVTPPAGYVKYLGATSQSAYTPLTGDYFAVYQPIEGLNVYDLAWGTSSAATVTLSFWVRSSLTGTFSGSLYNNAGSTQSYVFNYTINSANTWQQIILTITGPTSGTWNTNNTEFVQVRFGLGTGTTYSTGTTGSWISGNYVQSSGSTSVVSINGATFYITGVQLEKGTQATPFDFRDYGRELIMCQRYCYATSAAGIFQSTGVWAGASGGFFQGQFPVTLRAIPILVNSAVSNYSTYNVGAGTYTVLSSMSLNGVTSTEYYLLNFGSSGSPGSTGWTTFLTCYNGSSNSGAILIFSAEL